MLEVYKSAAVEQLEVSSCIGPGALNRGATQSCDLVPETPTFMSDAIPDETDISDRAIQAEMLTKLCSNRDQASSISQVEILTTERFYALCLVKPVMPPTKR